jgi:hypothetical protein
VTHPVYKRTVDRKDALLSAGRSRSDTARLSYQRVVKSSEIDLNGWRIDLQVFA